ncbi:MAG: Gfo/Idh/MocA family oxidoreductase, partial [Pseudomonadota bacterium]
MSAPLRVICVGAGYFAAFHHEAWARHPRTQMVAVVDADIARARAVGPSAYESLSAALDAHDADIIDLVVPP